MMYSEMGYYIDPSGCLFVEILYGIEEPFCLLNSSKNNI